MSVETGVHTRLPLCILLPAPKSDVMLRYRLGWIPRPSRMGRRTFRRERQRELQVVRVDRLLWIIASVVLLVGSTTLIAQQITYTYDEAGRLIGVVDASGNAASYKYDATGNILSIQRYSASQVGIFDFTPNNGSEGTAVTLNGTGFSTVSSQNVVKFNGVPATVSSSTATQILANVPSGATTGSITVAAPMGTATSSDQFVVSGATGTPFISSFSPVIAGGGSTVTITGGNFSSAASNNDAKVNLGLIPISSATTSTLTATIPQNATSGRVSVSTATGTTVSSGDLFIQPSGQVVASGSTGRTNVGSSASLPVPGGGYTGLMIFDATAPRRVSVVLSASANSGSCSFGAFGGAVATLWDPLGNAIGQAGCFDGTTSRLMGGTDLLMSGTYTVRIQSETVAVNATVTVNDLVDFTASLNVNGPAVPVILSLPGQNGLLSFSGTANQQVTISVNSNSMCDEWTLINPDGSATALPLQCGANFSVAQTLPATGTYKLKISSVFSQTGSMNVSVTSP